MNTIKALDVEEKHEEPLELHEMIRQIRFKLGLTPSQMARNLKVSYSYYTRLERPFEEGKALASEKLLRKLASLASEGDQEEEQRILRRLLQARAKILIPPELRYELVAQPSKEDFSDSMPEPFLKRVKADVDYVGLPRVLKVLNMPQSVFQEVLDGKRVLSREKVIRLAVALDQPIHEYLALSGYLPVALQTAFEKNKEAMQMFFRSIEKIPVEKVGAFLEVISELISLYSSKKYTK